MSWICSSYFLGFQGKGHVDTCISMANGCRLLVWETHSLTCYYFPSLVSETIPRHRDYQIFFPKEKIFYKKVS